MHRIGCIGTQVVTLGMVLVLGVTSPLLVLLAASALGLGGDVRAALASPGALAVIVCLELGLGLGLAWGMGRLIARPLESLRDQVRARAQAAFARPDIALRRGDELGEVAEAFNLLLGALAQRARSNEAFLADLAHEFKNPVAAVRACAERMGEGDALDATRAGRIAEVLRGSARLLDGLVTQFLELARAEAGLPDEAREVLDVSALLEGMARGLSESGRFPGVTVAVESSGPALVDGVAFRLESALRNVLDNAASFAGEGGRVRVSVQSGEGRARVAISDSGPGIAPSELPRVFERFFTTRGDRRGTGLGLALARAIVEAHGGRIWAESPPGAGAVFRMELPSRP